MLDKEFFGKYDLNDRYPVYELAGHVTIHGDANVRYHIDFVEDSVTIKFRKVEAVDALISDLMKLRKEMLNKGE